MKHNTFFDNFVKRKKFQQNNQDWTDQRYCMSIWITVNSFGTMNTVGCFLFPLQHNQTVISNSYDQ